MKYAWSSAVMPVAEFMRNPRRAPDAEDARKTIREMLALRTDWENRGKEIVNLHHESDALRGEIGVLEEKLRVLRNSRPVRMADAIGNFLVKLGIKP
jgi:hypothetical protein